MGYAATAWRAAQPELADEVGERAIEELLALLSVAGVRSALAPGEARKWRGVAALGVRLLGAP